MEVSSEQDCSSAGVRDNSLRLLRNWDGQSLGLGWFTALHSLQAVSLPSLGYEDRGSLNDNIAYEALDDAMLSEVRLTAIALKQQKARLLAIHLHGH